MDLLEADGSVQNQCACHSDIICPYIFVDMPTQSINLPLKRHADSSSGLPKIDRAILRYQLNIIFLAIDLSWCTLRGKFPLRGFLSLAIGCFGTVLDRATSESRSHDRCPARDIIQVTEAKSLVRSVKYNMEVSTYVGTLNH